MCTITKVLLSYRPLDQFPHLLSFPHLAFLPSSHQPHSPFPIHLLLLWPNFQFGLAFFPFIYSHFSSKLYVPPPFSSDHPPPSHLSVAGAIAATAGDGRVRLTVETVALALWGAHSPISPFAHPIPVVHLSPLPFPTHLIFEAQGVLLKECPSPTTTFIWNGPRQPAPPFRATPQPSRI